MPNEDRALRRAAILIASLDTSTADALLAQMPDGQADLVRRAIMELGDVDPDEERRVIDEFMRNGSSRAPRNAVDAELVRTTANRPPRSVPPATAVPPSFATRPEDEPFRFLHEADNEKLARLLSDERPQTIALVISHLPEDRAVTTLSLLPASMQADVIRRWGDLEKADPDILREVERGLQSRINLQFQDEHRRTLGLERVARILAEAEPRLKQAILANVEAHDAELAGQLGPRRLEFDDLEQFDDASLATLLKSADPQVAILALAGARASLVQRVIQNLPTRAAKVLRRSLDHMGPTRISDVEQAQENLAELADKLEAEGKIRGIRGVELSLAS